MRPDIRNLVDLKMVLRDDGSHRRVAFCEETYVLFSAPSIDSSVVAWDFILGNEGTDGRRESAGSNNCDSGR